MSVVAVIYSKASTRPDGFAPTTIRKYVIVHFVSESRIAVGPLFPFSFNLNYAMLNRQWIMILGQ